MDALINVVLPVFGIILTGYLAGRFGVLGPDSAAALNSFVYYFALPPALFIFVARAPVDKIFNWPFIGTVFVGFMLTLLIALVIGRAWFHHNWATLTVIGLATIWGNGVYMGLRTECGAASDHHRAYPAPAISQQCHRHFRWYAGVRITVAGGFAVIQDVGA